MKTLPENCSMYEAVLQNISDSTVDTAIFFYGRKYSFEKVFSVIDTLADNLAAEYSVGKGDTVTLYAVWQDLPQNTFLEALQADFEGRDAQTYTAQDWAELTGV